MNLQTQFPIRAARACVLLKSSDVRARLADFDLDEDSVIRACEEHWLAPALDLGLEARRDLRIWPSAVAFFDATGGARSRRVPVAELLEEALRGCDLGKAWLSGERVRAILNCTGGHVNNLVDGGWLTVMPGTQRRRGPNGSDTITLASFKDFLKRRLL